MNSTNHKMITKIVGAIAASAFLSITAILPQAAFSQQSPGATGDPRVDEPNTNTRVDDPSRPAAGTNRNDVNRPANSVPSQGGVYSNPSGQMNDAGVGGGAGGSTFNRSEFNAGPKQPANRIERYTQPGATDPSRSTDYLPPANSPASSNSNGRANDTLNNSGVGGGSGGDAMMNRGSDRYTAPNSNMPGNSTYSTPRSQINNTGSGTGTGGTVDSQINNSTSPGSATPRSGSTNSDTNRGSTPNNSGSTPNNSGSNVNSGGMNQGGGAGGTGSVPGLW